MKVITTKQTDTIDLSHYEELVWEKFFQCKTNWERFELADRVEIPEVADEIRARIKDIRESQKEKTEKQCQN